MESVADLPHEALSRVLERLDARSIATLARAGKTLRVFCLEEPLWMAIAVEAASKDNHFTWRQSWFKSAVFAELGVIKGFDGFAFVEPLKGLCSDFLYRRWYRSHLDVSQFVLDCGETVVRENGKQLTVREFVTRFEQPAIPVVISNIPELQAVMTWNISALEESFGEAEFTVSQTSKGGFNMKLANYLEYARMQWDEDPLYLFDSDFDTKATAILEDYTVPPIFSNDLLPLLGADSERPDYRWLLIGPPRSGSSWHIDPWGSSAWNHLVSGRKRWALYPPGKIPPGVRLLVDPSSCHQSLDFDSCTALQWFLEVLPSLNGQDKPLEFVQHPGETVFIPHGWWHSVLNLEMTVSVTQNFVSPAHIQDAIHLLSRGACEYYSGIYTVKNRNPVQTNSTPRLHCRWIGALAKATWDHYPDLRGQLWQSGKEYMYVNELLKCLSKICTEHNLPPPEQQDVFPICATSNLIFRLEKYMIKLFFHKNPLNLCIQHLAESQALQANAHLKKTGRLNLSDFIGRGVVDFYMEKADAVIEVPYIVSTYCGGQQMSDVFQKFNEGQKFELSKELGQTVAVLHSTANADRAYESSKRHSNEVCSAYKGIDETCESKDQEFDDLCSASTWLHSAVVSQGTFFQAQDPDRIWSQSLSGLITTSKSTPEPRSRNAASVKLAIHCSHLEAHGGWGPFLAFLQWRHAVILQSPSRSCLPEHLLAQIKTYLPTTMEALLPPQSPVTLSRPPPVRLHGDLTSDNILIKGTEEETVYPCIVDFGDACYGDPLYDFVALSLSTLECDSLAIGAFAEHYFAEFKTRTGSEQFVAFKENRSFPLSYYIMCYAILHEDNAFGWLFENHPEYQKFQSLNEIEQALWGTLTNDSQTCHFNGSAS